MLNDLITSLPSFVSSPLLYSHYISPSSAPFIFGSFQFLETMPTAESLQPPQPHLSFLLSSIWTSLWVFVETYFSGFPKKKIFLFFLGGKTALLCSVWERSWNVATVVLNSVGRRLFGKCLFLYPNKYPLSDKFRLTHCLCSLYHWPKTEVDIHILQQGGEYSLVCFGMFFTITTRGHRMVL